MKRILLSFTVIFLFLTINSSAQIKKDAIFLGGNIGGNASKTTSAGQTIGKNNGITISPVFGKAIKENLVWGANLDFSMANYSYDNSYPNKQKQKIYGAGIFVRKYKTIGNSGFYFFLQGGLKGDYLRSEYTYSTPETRISKQYIINTNFYPGISYTISKKLQLETGFNDLIYLSYTAEKDYVTGMVSTVSKANGFSLGTSFSNLNSLSNFYVGFRVLLN
jgi:hypothetical protein